MNEWVSMEHCSKGTDGGKLKYSEKNLSHCHFVHHQSHMNGPGFEAEPLWWQASNFAPEPLHAQNLNCTTFIRPENVLIPCYSVFY
jgi:hypothetical protein